MRHAVIAIQLTRQQVLAYRLQVEAEWAAVEDEAQRLGVVRGASQVGAQ